MKKDNSLLQLQLEKKKRIKIAADSLLKNDKATAKDNIEWVELATDLTDKLRKEPDKIKLSVIIGLVSVLLIGLGLTLRMPNTKISVDVFTKSVSLNLKEDWTFSNRFSASEMLITNLKEVKSAGANVNIANQQPFTFNLKGKDIVIDKLVLHSNAELTIQLKDNLQHFIIKKDSLVTDIQVGKAEVNTDNGQLDMVLNDEIPQIFTIRTFESKAIPVSIILSDTAQWSIRDIVVSHIYFLEESAPGSGKFSSSILSGSVKVLEIDKETRLEEGDRLGLEGLNVSRIQISKASSDLKIHIEGDVFKASTGSELFERNLNPTIIEYLYHAKSFAFFWSCIVFIWSLLWSFKNTLFSK
jgi:hypothetical protein